ncbi:helix-turn-helix transcriptional regulator [Actibacterium ureilyticum]|uniref:helix-turn-helix transcriptional regulator n=1 Tax=Actibacterium ureilyticum TaxID=1590614 RepID=UPI001FEB51A8|nr:AlpA family phage regulatory protein [Actibacterium ureilyticum]
MKGKKMTDEILGKTLATRDDLKRMGITLSNTTLLRLEARGRFPRRVRIGGTTVAWLMSELSDWLTERDQERARTHYADY